MGNKSSILYLVYLCVLIIVSCKVSVCMRCQYYHKNPAIFDRAIVKTAMKEVTDFTVESKGVIQA